MIKIFINLAKALAESFFAEIKRLDIRYDEERDEHIGILYLIDDKTPNYIIREDGTVKKAGKSPVSDDKPVDEVMKDMKEAVDNLKVPHKPKEELESAGGGGY